MMTLKFDLIIIGGGMIGSSLALAAANKGLRVKIFEINPPNRENLSTDQPDLRVSSLNRQTISWLKEIKIWPELNPNRYHYYDRLTVNELNQPPVELMATEIAEDYLGIFIENNYLQAKIWQQLQEKQVVIDSSGPIKSIVQHQENLSITTQADQINEGGVLVIADGVQSKTRQLAGIGVRGSDYKQHCLQILIKINQGVDYTWQTFYPSGPRAYLPLYNNYAMLVWYDQPNKLQTLATLSNTDLQQELAQAFPTIKITTVLKKAKFPLKKQQAQRYQQHRIVLAGDAAHSIHPHAGQGANLGFADVSKLWSLQQEGRWLTTELQTYGRERYWTCQQMLMAMDGVYQMFSQQQPVIQSLRHFGLQCLNSTLAKPLRQQLIRYAVGY